MNDFVDKDILRSRSELYKLFQEKGFNIGAEVGVWEGYNACDILKNCNVHTLLCIDPWDGNGMSKDFNGDEIYKKAIGVLEPYGQRVRMMRMTSEEAASLVEDYSLDFVYIDGLHDFDNVVLDINLWLPKIRVGGVISGHDYKNITKKKQVKRAVDGIFGERTMSTKERCPNWWVEVVDKDSFLKLK